MSQEGNAAQRAIICNPIQNDAAVEENPPPRFLSALPFYSLRPTSGGPDWTKQCWDAETNLELLNINSGSGGRRRIIMRG